jgi:hypothetical protein
MAWREDLPPERFEALAQEVAKQLGRKIGYDLLVLSRTCVVCEHWRGGSETCGLNGQRPPATVIAFGCELFERFVSNGLD